MDAPQSLSAFWFLPTFGGGRYLGSSEAAHDVGSAMIAKYLSWANRRRRSAQNRARMSEPAPSLAVDASHIDFTDAARDAGARVRGERVFRADYVAGVAKVARMRGSPGGAWGLLVLLFALSLAARLVFVRQLDQAPFAAFLPAAPIAALACGWRKAVVLLAASAIATVGIAHSRPDLLTPSYGFRMLTFLALGGFMIALTEALAQAVQQLESVAEVNAELFRELQHRVSNNFMIVAATLQKARRNLADPVALEAIDGAAARIAALGRLHRRLYDPGSYRDGIEPILREVLVETFQDVAVDITLDIKAENLSVGQLTTIVLLVNEAAINAAKHVFALQRGERFSVTLRADGRDNLLTVRDDGPGFAAPDNAPTSRFGLAVMRGLASQLGGALEVLEGGGTTIRVAFNR